jgi:hypothetical protein
MKPWKTKPAGEDNPWLQNEFGWVLFPCALHAYFETPDACCPGGEVIISDRASSRVSLIELHSVSHVLRTLREYLTLAGLGIQCVYSAQRHRPGQGKPRHSCPAPDPRGSLDSAAINLVALCRNAPHSQKRKAKNARLKEPAGLALQRTPRNLNLEYPEAAENHEYGPYRYYLVEHLFFGMRAETFCILPG